MREITFVQMPAIGPGLIPPRTGSPADLVIAIPYLLHDQIPPRRVLNGVLTRGKCDAGMSGGVILEPFELDTDEYEELVAELQRRGTRPIQRPDGLDPGGHPFDVPDVPEAVQTFGEWHVYRYRTSEPTRQRILESEWEPLAGRYQRWLSALPVGDLYIAQIAAERPDWEERSDAAVGLPAEFVNLLRDLKRCHDEWHGHTREELPRLMEERQRVDRAINECADRANLPRWPFERGHSGA